MNSTNAHNLLPSRLLAALAIEHRAGPESLRAASAELAAVGVVVSADDLRAILASVRADRNPMTGEWRIPGAQPPTWGYDGLQDAIMDRTGLRGAPLARAWTAVKGRLRLRWAGGDSRRPSDATVVRWALAAG